MQSVGIRYAVLQVSACKANTQLLCLLTDRMGAYFSKIGSDPYYANYERSFQRLRKDIDRLKVGLPEFALPAQVY